MLITAHVLARQRSSLIVRMFAIFTNQDSPNAYALDFLTIISSLTKGVYSYLELIRNE